MSSDSPEECFRELAHQHVVGEGLQKYFLDRKLGSGSYGIVYLGINITDANDLVAVKVEYKGTRHPSLRHESEIYKILEGGIGVPRLKWFGEVEWVEGTYNAMIMDNLGNSLEKLHKSCNKNFSLKTVLMLADQLLERVEFVHSKGYLHRDIKPSNLVMGLGSDSHRLFIIDFGLAKKYVDSKNRHIFPSRLGHMFGTCQFMSLNAHLTQEQSRRDDLECVGYTLVYLMQGFLPWEDISARNKIQMLRKTKQAKQEMSIGNLCENLPPEFEMYFEYCSNLKFQDYPDYTYLRSLFSDLYQNQEFEPDFKFDWIVNDELWSEQVD